MKPLATSFKKNGFQFELVQRDGMVALYKKKQPHHSRWSFETIIVQSHNGYEIAGTKIEPAETYPTSTTWGQLGWTPMSLEEGMKRFNQTISKQ